MKVVIVTNLKIEDKPEKVFPNVPIIKHLRESGDLVSVFHTENDEIYLADYLNESDESFFQEVRTKRLFDKLDDIDVIYITSPTKLAFKVKKAALELNIPIVAEFVKQETKEENKEIYRNFYKYVNAVHYRSKDEQEELEYLVGRRTNGHVFDGNKDDINYLSKIRDMLICYADPINHNNNKKLYYADEINDDFAINKIKVKKSKKPFKYIHRNPLWVFFELLIYHVIARPLVWILNKVIYHQRIKNKRVLKRFRKRGYLIYSNHTNGMPDAFTPNLLSRKRNYIVVGRETVSIKGLKGLVTMLGAIPVYADISEVEGFNECIKKRILQKKSVTIYPEAHIWPYYTKIRHFKRDSFRYPVELNCPVYVLTNTWQKRRFGKRPKLVSYLSGPVFPDETLGRTDAMEDLKEKVFFEMVKITRSVKQVEKIQYIKVKK